MSKKVKVKLIKKGVGELLKSQEMQNECKRLANAEATSDQHIKSFVGFSRAVSIIYPNTKKHLKE